MVDTFLFLFGALSLLFSILVVSSKNPIHSILYLIASFFSVTLILIVLGAEFIAITFLIVYVGAIAVLLLFVVMMLNIKIIELENNFWKYIPIGFILSVVLLFQLVSIVLEFDFYFIYDLFFYKTEFAYKSIVLGKESSMVITKTADSLNFININYELTNTELLGWLVYTYSFFSFLVISLILLVAMIGSIILVLNQNINIKRQIIFRQTTRDMRKSISLKS